MNEPLIPLGEELTATPAEPVPTPDEPAVSVQERPAPHPPKREKDRGGSSLAVFSLLLSVVAIVLSSWALWTVLPARSEQVPPPDVSLSQPDNTGDVSLPAPTPTITYNGKELPIHPDVGLNQYDAACFATDETGRVTYTSGGKQALTGIDVSYYQGEIDWKQVKESGIDFAMIRVGFRGYGKGVIVEDTYFQQNIAGALEAGVQVGVYFFSQAINVWEAEEEAAYVLDAIQGYDVTFPVVFDWERIHNAEARTDGLSSEALTRCAGAFCDMVSQAGYIPAIYFNQDQGYLSYDLPRLKDYNFWLAEYRSVPTFYYHFDLWQYSAKGKVPGIKGDVDLNLSFVDFSQWG